MLLSTTVCTSMGMIMVRRGMVWYGLVWYGLVWYGYGIIMDMAMDMVGLVVHDACHGRLQYVNSGEIRGKKRQETRKVGSEA